MLDALALQIEHLLANLVASSLIGVSGESEVQHVGERHAGEMIVWLCGSANEG